MTVGASPSSGDLGKQRLVHRQHQVAFDEDEGGPGDGLGITICVPVPFAEALARSWAWFAACGLDDWHGHHGTNDSRGSDTPAGILGVLGKSAC